MPAGTIDRGLGLLVGHLGPQVLEVIEMAADMHVEVLAIPGLYEEMAPEAPIFYLGDFPVTAIHRRDDKAVARGGQARN